MKKKEKELCKEELRQWAVKWTKCDAQHTGYPCGTCFCHLLGELGVRETGLHNDPVERTNEVWRALLQIRGDYDPETV